MENSKLVLQDIDEIKSCIKNLSEEINKANVEWKDEKFNQLFESIQEIAHDSKDLLETGEKCEKMIKKFETYNK